MTTPQRVARDIAGERTRYEDIVVGDDLGTMEWSFDEAAIARLCETDDDFHEWYSVESPYGGVIAPVLINYPPVRILFSRKYNVRGLFYWYEVENYAPLKPNVKYTLSGRISDKWIKRDREYVQYQATCSDSDGTKIFFTRRTHALDYLTRDVPKVATGIDSGAGGRLDDAH
ncbi:MAG: hypothetical protein HY525_03240 [Betaproteobacteria bacterium]|nr:hypothetical protein [Betaproteobacteria bacterium]